jgi:tetratricopeptide (TPR) repeat protein
VAVDRGRWAEAEEWYLRALELLDGGGPDGLSPEAARPLRWRLFQNLGITARERGVLDESDRWYRRAEEESMGLGDPAATVEVENGRGQLELARGRPRAAEVRFRAALEALTTPRADAVRVAVRANLGEALLRQGRALEAGVVAREAEAEAIQGRHLGRLPEVYRLLGRVARARGEAEAFVFVERALELVREAGLPPFEEALSLLAYAELREEQGEMDMAREAREGARVILDQLDVTRPELEAGDDTQRDGGVS